MKRLIPAAGRGVMRQAYRIAVLLVPGVLASAQLAQGQTISAEDKIQNAMSAAPLSIARNATILDWPAKEGDDPVMLREGSSDWTCFPDYPASPSNDPTCLDKTWMEWFKAYMNKTEPKITAPGIAYMLQGGSDASYTDPFAGEPPAGEKWLEAPPHLMMVFPGKLDPAVFSSEYNSGGPWIMWGGTPYEHLMIPVK